MTDDRMTLLDLVEKDADAGEARGDRLAKQATETMPTVQACA
jgi:hypothetical protein